MELLKIRTNSKSIKQMRGIIIERAIEIMREQEKVNVRKLASEFDIAYSSCYRVIKEWNDSVDIKLSKQNIE